MVQLEGVFAVIPTPFTEDEEFDEPTLRRLVDDLLAHGVHGIIPTGSTGEVASLTEAERLQCVEVVMEQVDGRVPVVAGASANSTRDTIRYSRKAEEAGAAGVMIVHPYYCLPSELELERHYRDLAQSIGIPIMIYNNPFTTGVDMKPQQLARLAEAEPNLRYCKESSGDAARVGQILELTDKLTVLSGWDNLVLEHFLLGAKGWVAGSANLIPREAVELYRLAVVEGDWNQARVLYRRLYALLTILETTGKFVQYIKFGLAERGLSVGPPRRPMLRPEGEEADVFRRALRRARGVGI